MKIIPDLNSSMRSALLQMQQEISILNQKTSQPPFIQQSGGSNSATINTPVASTGKAWALRQINYTAASLSSGTVTISRTVPGIRTETIQTISIVQLQGVFDFGGGLLISYLFDSVYNLWMPTALRVTISGGSTVTLGVAAYQVDYSPI